MLTKRIAVAMGAALIVGAAWTATARAANILVTPADRQPVASAMKIPTAGFDGTATLPAVPGAHAPWYAADTTPSVPTTGAPFGWTIRMLAHMKQSGEASGSVLTTGTPFGWTVRMLAHLKHSGETTMPVMTVGERFGQWVRTWAHMGGSVDPTATRAPQARSGMKPGPRTLVGHGLMTANPGAAHRSQHRSATPGTPTAAAPSAPARGGRATTGAAGGMMSGSGGMMGPRH